MKKQPNESKTVGTGVSMSNNTPMNLETNSAASAETVDQIAERWASVNWVPKPMTKVGLKNVLVAAITEATAQLQANLDIERLRNEKYRAAWYAEQQKLERDLAAAEARVKELEARCESYQGLQFDYEMAKAELAAVQQDAQRLREALERLLQHDQGCAVNEELNDPHCCAYCFAKALLSTLPAQATKP
jgi:DNA repair exonuclease SbcCD ATPase subunit